MKKILVFLSVFLISALAMFAQVDEALPEGLVELFDGFEKGNYWIWAGFDWDQYGDHKISSGANISRDWASEGKHSLELTMEPMTADTTKSAIWFYDGTNNLAGTKYIVIDVYNPENYTYNLQAVVQCTDSWEWCSTPGYEIPKGKHTVFWDISKYAEYLHDVRRITVCNNSGQVLNRESHIYIDNIRLIK